MTNDSIVVCPTVGTAIFVVKDKCSDRTRPSSVHDQICTQQMISACCCSQRQASSPLADSARGNPASSESVGRFVHALTSASGWGSVPFSTDPMVSVCHGDAIDPAGNFESGPADFTVGPIFPRFASHAIDRRRPRPVPLPAPCVRRARICALFPLIPAPVSSYLNPHILPPRHAHV